MDGENALAGLAHDFSPRYESHGVDVIVIDITGLDRLFGDPARIGEELRRSALARGLRVQIAIAATRTAAMVLALARPGVTVVERGAEREALAAIPLGVLERIVDQRQDTRSALRSLVHSREGLLAVRHWGIRTLGECAALPPGELAARLGSQGLTWHALACGRDVRPLVPSLAEERFESSVELEWPIEGLEPLSFVLTRLLEPLSTRLERRDRGAAVLHVALDLVGAHDMHRDDREGGSAPRLNVADAPGAAVEGVSEPVYMRSLQLPAPIRDVRTLRTLILLDLESHPPSAPIERVAIVIDPTPGRVLQHALFARAHPTPEQLSTLMARLNALMGEDRVGRPALIETHRPGAFGMEPFPVSDDPRPDRKARPEREAGPRHPGSVAAGNTAAGTNVVAALRRCRRPVPARVSVAGGQPVAVTTDRRGFAGGCVLACAGPWRSSGAWWESDPARASWNRDEWDVSLSDGGVYRLFQDRVTDGWFIDAIVD